MRAGCRRLAVPVATALVLGVLAWGEVEHWRSAKRGLGRGPGRSGSGEAIVVLGFRNPGHRANLINRWRVRAALRSRQPGLGPSRLVLSGGAAAGDVPEAELMAAYARDERGYPGVLITEPRSFSTWENVENAIPFIEDADRIKIVSNSLHAEQARHYLRQLRPDLAERLVPAADYRFGELILVKPLLAVLGRWRLREAKAKVEAAAAAAQDEPAQIG
jgi:uncharacterized SAM-binding protein YcdF (DUF218 family)